MLRNTYILGVKSGSNFIADNILGKEEFFDEKETGKVVKITKDQRLIG